MILVCLTSAWARPSTPADLDRLRDLEQLSVAPDGRFVVAVTSTDVAADERRTHLLLGGDGLAPRALTSGDGDEHTPRIAPDGRSVVFLSSRGSEDGPDQVWSLPLDGGEARRLTDLPGGVSDLSWAPDGSRLVLVVDDPGPAPDAPPAPIVVDRFWFKSDGEGWHDHRHSHLALLELANGGVTTLTSGDQDELLPSFSPDGRRLVFVSRRGPDPDRADWNVWVTEARPGAPIVEVTPGPGMAEDPEFASRPVFGPDGAWIAATHTDRSDLTYYAGYHVGLFAADGSGEVRELLPGLDRNTWAPRFSADGDRLWVILEDDGGQSLAEVRADGRGHRVLSPPGAVVSEVEVGRAGPLVIASDERHFPEVHAVDRKGLRALTAENLALGEELDLAPIAPVVWTAPDGAEIHGFLLRPPAAAGPTPLLVWLHGGPVFQHSPERWLPFQLLAAHGYSVFLPNPRGSSGRGEAFSLAIWADWGAVDGADVLSGVDHLVAAGLADPERLAVGGWSYGGMLTDRLIAQDRRFDAAVSGAGIANVLAGYGTDQYVREYELELGTPWGDPDVWLRNSASFLHADRITTPTLFLCGTDDLNVPALGSEQLYQALRSLEVPSALVLYPGETHALSRPSFLRDRSERILGWLDAHVRSDEVATP